MSHLATHAHPRLALPLLFALATLPIAAAQTAPVQPTASTLPATQPTALAPSTNGVAPAVAATRPHRAEVAFADQQLTVRANDSSLHQILSSIARITGMKITGGVEEQRVFGSYGPADASTILATLLDGTGVNMLIREDDAHRPTELTLTPRTGGAGSPITAQEADLGADIPVPPPALQPAPLPAAVTVARPVQSQPQTQPQPQPTASGPPSIVPLNNPLGDPRNTTPTASQIPTTNSVPTDSLPTPSTAAEPAQGIVDSANPPPASAATPLTPAQIFQNLMQRQKDKAAAAAGQSSTPATTPPQ